MLTDVQATYKSVLLFPEEDTPRLLHADALREAGDADRAEFIEAQCELGRHDPCADCERKQKTHTGTGRAICMGKACMIIHSAELLQKHRAEWLVVKCETCGGVGYGEHVWADRCPHCQGGDAGGLTWPVGRVVHNPDFASSRLPSVTFARGFPAVVTVPRLADCIKEEHRPFHGSTVFAAPSAWLAAACRHHPIEAVVCLDREPWRWSGRWGFSQDNGPGMEYLSRPENRIPPPLYAVYEKITLGHSLVTRDEAVLALARALAAFGRQPPESDR